MPLGGGFDSRPLRLYGLKTYAGLDPAVLMQPMAVTSPQEESQSGTRARHAVAGPDAGRPTAFPDVNRWKMRKGRETPREHAEGESPELNDCGVGTSGPWSHIKPN